MDICIYVIGILLSYTLLLAPWWRNQQERTRREFEEVYHAFKLRMVRRYYTEYRHLSFAELEEEFDIDASFHNIGQYPH